MYAYRCVHALIWFACSAGVVWALLTHHPFARGVLTWPSCWPRARCHCLSYCQWSQSHPQKSYWEHSDVPVGGGYEYESLRVREQKIHMICVCVIDFNYDRWLQLNTFHYDKPNRHNWDDWLHRVSSGMAYCIFHPRGIVCVLCSGIVNEHYMNSA